MLREMMVAVEAAHPTDQGWRQLGPYSIDELDVDNVFYRKGQAPVAVLYMDDAFVRSEDVKLAQHLQCMYSNRMNGRSLHILLVYQGLLARPARMPNGVSVFTFTVCDDHTAHHNVVLN